MSTREIEKLLGHSLDDDQSNPDFSLERAQHTDLGLGWRGIKTRRQIAEKPFAGDASETEETFYER